MILLLSPCKLEKCILRDQSILGMCAGVSLQSGIASYWPGMHKTVVLVDFVAPCERGLFLTVLSSVRETFQKHKGKTFSILV